MTTKKNKKLGITMRKVIHPGCHSERPKGVIAQHPVREESFITKEL